MLEPAAQPFSPPASRNGSTPPPREPRDRDGLETDVERDRERDLERDLEDWLRQSESDAEPEAGEREDAASRPTERGSER